MFSLVFIFVVFVFFVAIIVSRLRWYRTLSLFVLFLLGIQRLEAE